jgi:hypothetical protein
VEALLYFLYLGFAVSLLGFFGWNSRKLVVGFKRAARYNQIQNRRAGLSQERASRKGREEYLRRLKGLPTHKAVFEGTPVVSLFNAADAAKPMQVEPVKYRLIPLSQAERQQQVRQLGDITEHIQKFTRPGPKR